MRLLLNVAYYAALAVASPFILYKLATAPRWRRGFVQRLGAVPVRTGPERCLWIHAASVGEVLAVRTLFAALQKALPDWALMLSTTTPEGRATAREKLKVEPFLFPIDVTPAIRASLGRVRPDAIILVEREIWPNFIAEAASQNIPVIVINGIVSESFVRRFRRLRQIGLDPLGLLALFAVQSETYRQRLLALGVDDARIRVTGSIKYDSLPTVPDPEARAAIGEALNLSHNDWVFVAGSTRETEEEAVLDAFIALRRTVPAARLILVPRHIDRRQEIARLVREKGLTPALKTEWEASGARPDRESVRIVDTFGQLETLYAIASAVFVGGTLTPESGGHNFLEPAGFGRPIVIGPHVRNFRAAADSFLEKEALIMVESSDSLVGALQELAGDPARATAMGERAAKVVDAHRGATGRTVVMVQERVGSVSPRD